MPHARPLFALAGVAVLAGPVHAQVAMPTVPAGTFSPRISPALTLERQQRFPSRMAPDAVMTSIRSDQAVDWIDPRKLTTAINALAATRIAKEIETRMAGKAIGFAFTVIDANGVRADATNGWARKGPPDGAPRAWTANDRITIASVSKTITAAAIMRALDEKKIGLGEPAWQYLVKEPYWKYSDSFKAITIRELLNHTSGLRGCGIDQGELSDCVSKPVYAANKSADLPLSKRYQNTNYALLRMLLPRLYNLQPAGAAENASAYIDIVRTRTLQPAGIANAQCKSTGGSPALSYESTSDAGKDQGSPATDYDWTNVKAGLDWGDMTEICGSQGWNLSAADLAKFMRTLTTTETIVRAPSFSLMRNQQLGLFPYNAGGGLTAFFHGGWHPASWNNGEVNTVAIAFNNGVTIGGVINSRYKGNYMADLAEAVREGGK